ncbi:gamma-glutamyltransferase, partial [Acidobacteriota bacterium]
CSIVCMVMLISTCSKESTPSVDLSPANWSTEEIQRYFELGRVFGKSRPQGTGHSGMVANTSSPFAVHAGLKALQQGGSAVDAVMTTALTQVMMHMGGATSYAGQMSLTYFEAATGKVHVMDAGYATLLEEDDPLTIPPYGTPSGRAVLVPGFMAGVEAAHKRFGKLPFEQLFAPAIYLAEEGFDIPPHMATMLKQREHVVTRLPEGRAIFTKENGDLYSVGDRMYQLEAAKTLKRVAAEGAGYMYGGEWGQKLVNAVRKEGGKMTLDDLQRYKALWPTVMHSSFREYEIYAPARVLETFNLLELADLRTRGRTSESAESLYWFIKISRVADILGPQFVGATLSPEIVERILPGLDMSLDARVTKKSASMIWEAMQGSVWKELELEADKIRMEDAESIKNLIKDFSIRSKKDEESKSPNHTAGIVAVDKEGNMAVVVHSVTSAVWGETGIFVDGISVVDPGAFAQKHIKQIGPGKHWQSSGGGPPMVLKDGKPVLGCGSTGASYLDMMVQGMHNALEFGLDPKTAAEQPMFRKNWPPGVPLRQPVGEGEFTREILEAVRSMGIELEIVEDKANASHGGSWVVIIVDPESGELKGAVTPTNSGIAEGY